MMAGFAVACFGSVHHALGVASLTMGEADRAVTHLREAVHRDLALGHWPAVLASRRRYAQALLFRGDPGDEAAAHAQLAQAQELAASLGVSVSLPVGRATCTRQDRRWRVTLGTRAVLVDHSVGMLHLAVLLANPDTEIAAIDLVAGLDAQTQAARTSTQPVLDRTAIQRYRQRLVELRDEIDHHESQGNTEKAAPARVERDWVLAELGASTGAFGRTRTFTDDQERARLSVGKAIRRALNQIERADNAVGAHLRASVHTGLRCWYRPFKETT
jgi:hypothetical protein